MNSIRNAENDTCLLTSKFFFCKVAERCTLVFFGHLQQIAIFFSRILIDINQLSAQVSIPPSVLSKAETSTKERTYRYVKKSKKMQFLPRSASQIKCTEVHLLVFSLVRLVTKNQISDICCLVFVLQSPADPMKKIYVKI